MLKLKIISLSIIILFSAIPISLGIEQNTYFHIFDTNYLDERLNTIEIPINIESFEIKKTDFGYIRKNKAIE